MRSTPLVRTMIVCLAGGAALFALRAWADPDSTTPAEGIRTNPPNVHALTNAKVVTEPGVVIENATVVIRRGVIEAVGGDVRPPAEARVWDMTGRTIYPGLIDGYGEIAIPADNQSTDGSRYWNGQVRPERRAAEHFRPDATTNRKLRSQGITARLIAPSDGLVKGVSAVVTTGDDSPHEATVKADVALHLRMNPRPDGGRGGGGGPPGQRLDASPTSPMGAVALLRQVMLDAQWYDEVWKAWRADRSQAAPEKSISLEQLNVWLARRMPVVIDTSSHLYALRADRLASEFNFPAVLRGSGREYRRLDAIAASGRAVLTPVSFPRAPGVATAEDAEDATLADLMHWDIAPENPARLAAAGVTIALTTDRLEDAGGFLAAVRQAVKRGFPARDALAAMTTTPARLFGVDDQLGTIRAGRRAHLFVTDGDLFDEKTRVMETWVDGKRYEVTSATPVDPRGKWELVIKTSDDQHQSFVVNITGEVRRLRGALTLPQPAGAQDEKEKKPTEITLDKLTLTRRQLSAQLKTESLERPGVAMLSVTLGGEGEEVDRGLGSIVWPDGSSTAVALARTEAAKAVDEKPEGSESDGEGEAQPAEGDDPPRRGRAAPKREPKPALYAVNYPLGAFGRTGPPPALRSVLFKHATIWTSSDRGIIQDGWLLVQHGRIRGLGEGNGFPEADVVIDATGMHLSPGLIDCHSHIATDGGINEVGQAITAEVRIGDFIDPDDMSIYRQLAGGTTSANILHGSANAIGGQNQVVKFRWGASDLEMRFAQAPAGIKFALGENPKRSNSTTPSTRYPQSRMGVEQLVRDEFQAASAYAERWSAWRREGRGLPPRRDLQLDAVVEILKGERLIHCHAYRQDEMLALMRTCEDFNVTIATFQHVLEGYKVADVMARHGAGGSSFSDWWAFKFEVYDAIPYNGALMHNAGVLVSFNSDDDELARRLNLEAAKAVRYGGVPPGEALKFVTLNPAKQLRIDRWVGSLEAGKDADLVLWTDSPLSVYARVEQTWIDGRKYYDHGEHQAASREVQAMRAALIQRILDSDAPMGRPGEVEPIAYETMWPRYDIYCGGHVEDDHDHPDHPDHPDAPEHAGHLGHGEEH